MLNPMWSQPNGWTGLTYIYIDLHVHQFLHTGIIEDQNALHDDHNRCIHLQRQECTSNAYIT
jgi:hypothetical protein